MYVTLFNQWIAPKANIHNRQVYSLLHNIPIYLVYATNMYIPLAYIIMYVST